jgi:2-keto-4-pentenoate hydratase
LKLKDFNGSGTDADTALNVARAFVSSRRGGVSLTHFPGRRPRDMASAYAIQETAIRLWAEPIAGWKVGLVAPAEQVLLDASRLAGPIFARGVFRAEEDIRVPLRVIPGGFAAIEVELVAAVACDAPPRKTEWTLEEARTLVRDWHLGVEFAASPLATINDLGATVIVSDFGNNCGLVVGSRLDESLVAEPARALCRTMIDGHQVGLASAASLPGGPLEGLRFLAGHLASRGRPLRAGQWVSTGAITGVHPVRTGQQARLELVGRTRIEVSIVTTGLRG